MLNVVICGTPGTGKSALIEMLKERLPDFSYTNASKFALDSGCAEEYDATLDTHVTDEDLLVEKLTPVLEEKKLNVVEFIHGDVLPDKQVDWVYVLRTDSDKLYDRLELRGYKDEKLTNNLDAEIHQVILDEALEYFGAEKLTELKSNDRSDLEKNVEVVVLNVTKLRKSKNL